MIYTYDARILLAWICLQFVPRQYLPAALEWLGERAHYFVRSDDNG